MRIAQEDSRHYPMFRHRSATPAGVTGNGVVPRIWRSRGGQDTADNMELFHVNCHRQIHVQEERTKAAASREGRS